MTKNVHGSKFQLLKVCKNLKILGLNQLSFYRSKSMLDPSKLFCKCPKRSGPDPKKLFTFFAISKRFWWVQNSFGLLEGEGIKVVMGAGTTSEVNKSQKQTFRDSALSL